MTASQAAPVSAPVSAPVAAPAGALSTPAAIAQHLKSRQPLPAGLASGMVRAGVAEMLAAAGAAIAPQSAKGLSVVSALGKIESLAAIPGALLMPWMALRALNLPKGAQVAVPSTSLADPIVATLLAAGGFVPTVDLDAPVRGVFGGLDGCPQGVRAPETLVSGARIVEMTRDQLTVSTLAGAIAVLDVLADASGALAALDATFQVQASGPAAAKIGPLSYNAVQLADNQAFSATIFTPYLIRRIEVPGAQPHPTPLVESSALASVYPPAPAYQPHFHPEIVQKGVLSDVQLETVIYAGEAHGRYLPSNPDDPNAPAPRQGYLVGHGTGVGKGRIVAGIMADNWAQGRRRHVWFSESAHLIGDARRDWTALGGRAEDIIDIRELPAGQPIPSFSGILFSTYAGMRSESENGSRLKQIIDWFGHSHDGVIAFDEAQNLRNAKANSDRAFGATGVSRQGEASLELQTALPNARVTYVSATSASDIASMGFAVRLGLWGNGTAFKNARAFFSAMEEGGVNALEMVARDLKAMGLYLAANLSFDGVKYERLERKLTLIERDTQDRLAEIWTKVNAHLNRALITTGISAVPVKVAGRTHKLGTIHFSMARARFFQAVLAAMKTPMVIEAIREDIRNGHAAIVQLTNTFAANADRAIDEAIDEGRDLSTVEASPKDILIAYLRDHFPVGKVQVQGRGRTAVVVPVIDPATGEQMLCPRAVADRDALIAEVEAMPVPEGPLEQILDAFGPDMVAEVTGRTRRLVPDSLNGGAGTGSRRLEERLPSDKADDVAAFMDDLKPILVFSSAGATGATYSAAKTARNQRLRRHYLLQPGWRADLALQGMGRSHRSHQAQAPEFVLVTTDLWSDRRMISAVAKGMRNLGALTRGLRQAASQDFFTQDDNLEDEFGETAWLNFVNKLAKNSIHGLSIGQFEKEAGVLLRDPVSKSLYRPIPPVRRFLNAMSAMSCKNQELFGQHYSDELDALKIAAIEGDDFDRGIETIRPDSLVKLEDTVIYRDPRTGSETRLLQMLRVDHLDPISYTDARTRAVAKGNASIVKSAMTGRIAILVFPRLAKGVPTSPADKVEVITPTGARMRTRAEVVREGWNRVDILVAESLWNAELTQRGTDEEQIFWVISGAMLPIWNNLPRNRPVVYRMETEEGEQIIGRLVSEKFVETFLTRVDALSGGGLPVADVEAQLIAGGLATLSNGWTLESSHGRMTGILRVTMTMPDEDVPHYTQMLQRAQLTAHPLKRTGTSSFYLPNDDVLRSAAIAIILGEAPALTMSSI